MLRIAVVLTALSMLLVPTALAEPDVVREARGCVNAIVDGGSYHGNIIQCEGGAVNRGLVDEVVACISVQLYGGSFYGQYIACNGIGVIPLVLGNDLVKDAVGCAKALATGGQYSGTYMQCG